MIWIFLGIALAQLMIWSEQTHTHGPFKHRHRHDGVHWHDRHGNIRYPPREEG